MRITPALFALLLSAAPALAQNLPSPRIFTAPAADNSTLAANTQWVRGLVTPAGIAAALSAGNASVNLGTGSITSFQQTLAGGALALTGTGQASSLNSFVYSPGARETGTCSTDPCSIYYFVANTGINYTAGAQARLFEITGVTSNGWNGNQSLLDARLTASVPPLNVAQTTVATSQGSGSATLVVASATGIAVGQGVSDALGVVPLGTFVSAISGTTLTLSNATTAPLPSGTFVAFVGLVQQVSGVQNTGATTLVMASTTGISVGMTIFGSASIPTNQTVTAVTDATHITISSAVITTNIPDGTPLAFGPPQTTFVVSRHIMGCTTNMGGVSGGTQNSPFAYNGSCFGQLIQAKNSAGGANLNALRDIEMDMESTLPAGPLDRTGILMVLSNNDIYRGARSDAVFQMNAQPGASVLQQRWKNGFLFGGVNSGWPFAPDSVLINAVAQNLGGYAWPMQADTGIDFSQVVFTTASVKMPGFSINPTGTVQSGPLTITPGSGKSTIDTTLSVAASAVAASGGAGYKVGDEVGDSAGNVYLVATIGGGGAVTGLTLKNASAYASPPSNPLTTVSGSGTGLTVTVTWTSPGGVVIAGASSKVGFYAVSPVAKQTPSGACSGNTGCQALRGALGALGLINTGSITD